ncbi:MAG: hypothetical protein AAF660_03000 [Pseudomonadota bacterium]
MHIKKLSKNAGVLLASLAPTLALAHHHTESEAAVSSGTSFSSVVLLLVALAVVASAVTVWKSWPTLARQQGNRR